MCDRLHAIDRIDLLCDRTPALFHERLGMPAVSAMVVRNITTQAGLPPGEDPA